MTKTQNISVLMVGAMLVATFYFALWVVNSTQKASGSAPSGLPATQINATTTDIGLTGVGLNATGVTIFAAKPNCSARIISVLGTKTIMLSFDEKNKNDVSSSTLSATVGHPQFGTSTTVYDSGTYGCGRVTGWSSGTTTITATETN